MADGRAAAEGLASEVVERVEQATVRTAAAERAPVSSESGTLDA